MKVIVLNDLPYERLKELIVRGGVDPTHDAGVDHEIIEGVKLAIEVTPGDPTKAALLAEMATRWPWLPS